MTTVKKKPGPRTTVSETRPQVPPRRKRPILLAVVAVAMIAWLGFLLALAMRG